MTTTDTPQRSRSVPATQDEVLGAARRSKVAAADLAQLSTSRKNDPLVGMAAALRSRVGDILAANEQDVEAAIQAGTADSLVDRLRLTEARVEAMARGLEDLVSLPGPIRTGVRGKR